MIGWSRPYFSYSTARWSSESFSSLKGEPGISCSRMNSISVMASRVNTEIKTRFNMYFFMFGFSFPVAKGDDGTLSIELTIDS